MDEQKNEELDLGIIEKKTRTILRTLREPEQSPILFDGGAVANVYG
jgi:hypothetical protein